MRRQIVILFVTGCVLISGCTTSSGRDDDPGGPTAADAATCDELQDLVVNRIARMVDLAGDMTTEEVSEALNDAAARGSGPFAFALSSDADEEIAGRSDALGCEGVDVSSLCSQLAQIRASGTAAQNLLNALLLPCESAGP